MNAKETVRVIALGIIVLGAVMISISLVVLATGGRS